MPIPTAAIYGGTALLNLGASIFGKSKEAKARRRFNDWIDSQSKKLESWYAKESSTDYLDTAEGRSAAEGLRRTLLETVDRNKEGAIKTGGSYEAQVASRESAFDSLGDAYRKLAGLGTQRKQNLQSMYLNQKNRLDSMRANNMVGQANAWSTFANNAGSNLSSIISAAASNGLFDLENKEGGEA